ncbi:MAG: hypothetical protein CFE45_40285 [Burkholderiales bacterium PBB5]|nr:MAG: hypothetical protein CFE45_40285 [Burkholderiales bacterium PBB5]
MFQLVATLERYELEVDALLGHWPDTERYAAVRKHMDNLQMYSSSVPAVAVAAVGLLIAHSELVFPLWRADTRQPAQDAPLQRARATHRDSVATLRRQCLR